MSAATLAHSRPVETRNERVAERLERVAELLERVPGFGPRRVQALKVLLESRLGRYRPRRHREAAASSAAQEGTPSLALQPSVGELLSVDEEYRTKAEAHRLPVITPRRFNGHRAQQEASQRASALGTQDDAVASLLVRAPGDGVAHVTYQHLFRIWDRRFLEHGLGPGEDRLALRLPQIRQLSRET